MEWEILMTTQVEAFLDDLYGSDPVSHQLVNQGHPGPGGQRPGGGPAARRYGDGVADSQHEGAAGAVGQPQ